jgi:hypothetical protein
MAINDFEYASPLDEEITSKSGKTISRYLESKKRLDHAVSAAVESSYDFGYLLGSQDTRDAIIEWVKENRRTFELEEGVEFYRDSFSSEDLIKFIEGLDT